MLEHLMILAAVFCLSLLGCLAFRFWQSVQQEMVLIKALLKHQTELLIHHEQALASVNQEGLASAHCLHELKGVMNSLETRYQAIHDGKSKDYHQVSNLIKKGFDHEEMMKSFGLSRGEIQLMKSLNRSKTA